MKVLRAMRYIVVSPFDSIGKIPLKRNHLKVLVHKLKTQKSLSCYVSFYHVWLRKASKTWFTLKFEMLHEIILCKPFHLVWVKTENRR